MRNHLISLAKKLYYGTSSRKMREFYFNTFCALVRGRKVQADVEGMTYELDLGEVIDLTLYLGMFERETTAAIDRLCKPGWIVLDIGANIGAHALRFARNVGSQGMVHAFEPTDYGTRKLQRNIGLNHSENVRVYRIALSDRNLPGQTVSFRSSWRTDRKNPSISQTVDFVRLDDWCSENRIDRVDLVKLDVDGNEFGVVKGGIGMFRRFAPIIIMEVGAYHFEAEGTNPLRLLSELGYRFWDEGGKREFDGLSGIRGRLAEIDPALVSTINIIGATRPLAPSGPQ